MGSYVFGKKAGISLSKLSLVEMSRIMIVCGQWSVNGDDDKDGDDDDDDKDGDDDDDKDGDDDELHLPKTKGRVVAKALHHRGEGAV